MNLHAHTLTHAHTHAHTHTHTHHACTQHTLYTHAWTRTYTHMHTQRVLRMLCMLCLQWHCGSVHQRVQWEWWHVEHHQVSRGLSWPADRNHQLHGFSSSSGQYRQQSVCGRGDLECVRVSECVWARERECVCGVCAWECVCVCESVYVCV